MIVVPYVNYVCSYSKRADATADLADAIEVLSFLSFCFFLLVKHGRQKTNSSNCPFCYSRLETRRTLRNSVKGRSRLVNCFNIFPKYVHITL